MDNQHLLITFKNRQTFLDHYDKNGVSGGFYVAEQPNLPIGVVVDIEIVFTDDLMVFHTRASIQKISAPPEHRAPAGVRFEFLESEKATSTFLLEYAKGNYRSFAKRRPRRFPLEVKVAYTAENIFHEKRTENINRTGCFILTEHLLDAGTLVAMKIESVFSKESIRINAEVAWRKNEVPSGFGVRFLIGDSEKQAQLDRMLELLLIAQLREQGEKKIVITT